MYTGGDYRSERWAGRGKLLPLGLQRRDDELLRVDKV